MASVEMSNPVTSLKCASLIPPISKRNRKFLKGSFLTFRLPPFFPGNQRLELHRSCAGRQLCDSEDHEFRWPSWRDTNHDDQTPVVDIVVGHRAAIYLDEEGLF